MLGALQFSFCPFEEDGQGSRVGDVSDQGWLEGRHRGMTCREVEVRVETGGVEEMTGHGRDRH